jgi:hypothetical protein
MAIQYIFMDRMKTVLPIMVVLCAIPALHLLLPLIAPVIIAILLT